MNRTDRLLAIVLELQAKKQVRAEDLADTFEVSKRTIYRDIMALDESGVPIVAIPGQGYSLVEGYFLPPLSFSSDEAIMLLLGADFVAQNFDAQYRGAAQTAGHKIMAVLPDKLRTEVEYLESSIRFIALTGSFAPDSASSNVRTREGRPRPRRTAKTAAASVLATTAPSSRHATQGSGVRSFAPRAVTPAVMSTPTVANMAAGAATRRRSETHELKPPAKRITAIAAEPTNAAAG